MNTQLIFIGVVLLGLAFFANQQRKKEANIETLELINFDTLPTRRGPVV